MKIFDLFRRSPQAAAAPAVRAMAGETAEFYGFDDPRFLEFVRNGNGSGTTVSVSEAMRNTAVFRCVSLISYSIAYLPLHLIDSESKEKVRDHSLFPLLHREPNNWQTAFNFRQLMQRRALVNGNAYALIVRSGGRVIRLVPIDPAMVTPRQRNDWSVEYVYTPKGGAPRVLAPEDVLHVYADSDDGLSGTSMVKVAAEAIALARDTERAQARLFRNGMMVGGALTHKDKLSPEAYERLKISMEERLTGVENAGKWMILEEGMEGKPFENTAKDSQQIETRELQVEEIGRAFGVPRPFLGVDDTSWGSGVDVLGQIFVRYALNPWFTAWEQSIKRSCLTDAEKDRLEAKFNAGALLRGSMKDQGEYFAKALGSGGHQPWMEYEEVRDTMDLPEKTIAPNPLARKLPELKAERLPTVCAFEPDAEAVDRWNAGIMAAQSSENTISVLDVIGEDFWTGGGVTSKRVAAALRAIGDQDVFVDINSPGGDFFEGVAIYNALRAHPKKVTVRVLGLAASAASIIAMAGDEIQIGKAGFLMVHNAWVVAIGNRHDLAEAAKTMEPFDDAMATVYSDRAGVKKAKAAEWMDNETWFNGEQAVAEGLASGFLAADHVAEDKTKAEAAKSVNATRRIDAHLAKSGIPRSERRALLSEMKGGTHDAAATVTHDAGDDLKAALEQLRTTIRS